MSRSPQIATRVVRTALTTPRLTRRCLHIPSTIPSPHSNRSLQFTIPSILPSRTHPYTGKGKGKAPDPKRSNEDEVEDAEWEMRVAQGMLHLRETLPLLLSSGQSSSDLFPPDIFSSNVVLKLPAPLPLRVSSLPAYSMVFSIARNGMQAFHSDLHTSMDRMTFPTSPPPSTSSSVTSLIASRKKMPTHRHKQIRVQLSVYGTPRLGLGPQKEAIWRTSSLYTFSPYSGLIASHEVETIRPLPGEGVSEWLMDRLLGWTSRQNEGAVPCPRAVPVNTDAWDKVSKSE